MTRTEMVQMLADAQKTMIEVLRVLDTLPDQSEAR